MRGLEQSSMNARPKRIALPPRMWEAMRPLLKADLLKISEGQRTRLERYGVRTSFRLKNGTVKEDVTVNWDGTLSDEFYNEYGTRAEVYGPPRFSPEEIESWGKYSRKRSPTWKNWFNTASTWSARVNSDGRVLQE